jgi:hypothetical protein
MKNDFQSDSGAKSGNHEAEDTAEVVAEAAAQHLPVSEAAAQHLPDSEAAAQHLPVSEAASQMNVGVKEAAKVAGGTRASEDSEEEKLDK